MNQLYFKPGSVYIILLFAAILFGSIFIQHRLPAQDRPQALIQIEEFIYDEAPFPSCHASTVAETPNGIVAAWFGGTHEKNKDVEIWFSGRIKGNWTEPISIANGIQHADKRYPCWNPVLFQVPGGPLQLYYKVGPDPREWWGEIKESNNMGISWTQARRLPEDIIGPVKNKPVLLSDGRLICLSSTEQEGWRVHLEVTEDFGKSWKIIGPLNDGKKINAIQPSLLTYPDEKFQILCRSKDNAIVTSWSEDGGSQWTQMVSTTLPNPNSGTDAVTLSNGWQLLVYNHQTKKGNQWGGKRSPLNISVSDNGHEWKALCELENEKGEYSYPAVIQSSDGKVHITYTWKREKIKYIVLDIAKTDFISQDVIKNGAWPDQ
ncbi:exo-alpha-sialidase [Bacteroidota bacterium]